jgi:hypothetical protein
VALLIIGLGVAVVSKSLPGAQQRQRRRRFAAQQDGRAQTDSFGQARMAPCRWTRTLWRQRPARRGGGRRQHHRSDGHPGRLRAARVLAALQGGDINVIMAGCEIDLRQASIEGEAVLNVFALCGGITIKIPPDWSVVLQGTPILGGFEKRPSCRRTRTSACT